MPASISRPNSDRYTTLASSGFLAVQDSASTVSSSVPLPNDTASRGPRPMSSTIKSAPPMTYNYFHGSKNDEDARSQVFNFKDDDASTINPGDSVSQLGVDRGEKKKLVGARALVPSTLGGVNRIEEEEEAQEGYGWVNPDAVLFDSDDHAGHDKSAFHPIEEQYEREEEDDDGRSCRSNRESASAPLVAGAEGISGHELESAFAPKTVGVGYKSVGGGESDDEGGEFGVYNSIEKARGSSIESRSIAYFPPRGSHLATAFAAPLSYVKSFRSSRGRGPPAHSDTAYLNTYPPPSPYAFNSRPDDDEEQKPYLPSTSRDTSSKPDPSKLSPAPVWQRLLWDTTPSERRVWEHQRGVGIQKNPWACWILSGVMTMVLILEMVRMAQYTGSPIQTQPRFNVMIGPSSGVLINSGARFAGCMKYIPGVSDTSWICLQDSNSGIVNSRQATCSMSDICGFGGFPPSSPNQSFRFVLPIFLHAGVLHLLLNLLAQVISSAQIERQMGTPKFLILYFSAGIFGFVMGGNFALVGQPSVGASGAIFGTHAAILVDLIAHWKIEYRARRKLIYLILEIIVGFGLGLVPGVDNFSHIGGFVMGLLIAILFLPIIHPTRRHQIIVSFLRLVAGAGAVTLFFLLLRNFYSSGDPTQACSWCRYLSCIPTTANNYCKGTGLEILPSPSFSPASGSPFA